ncbi:uncharacterized protein PHALS_12740 [Plasmopara halstedii]|uniref:Uncharacterized protein n=1 Tax=Plasmopara halstedii TaxID=4781 RepID=A0A0P1ANQ3_PLAHL|nr:uncharacterized protein PHALS_12740 [Plasmopara halstedii]CEG42465.1 hypothetical protein PHALS_12740 [Plasmopara halstedii]|eukprot:XP_024578834.1 hypothetical protein PHALS_12740 [Plasmopara halstedii]
MDTSSLREFALKRLQEAREHGTELATLTAARAASSISKSLPVSSSFVFRAQGSEKPEFEQQPLSMEKKLSSLKAAHDLLRASSTGTSGAMDEITSKLDLINESLAFSIENIQEGSHMMALVKRQLKDNADMKCPSQIEFYQRNERSTLSEGKISLE